MNSHSGRLLRQTALLILILSGTADASSDEVVFFPTDKYWRQYGHSVATGGPTLQQIKNVKPWQHGTYVRHPYYAFVKSKKTGKKMLISDGALRAVLTPIPGSQKRATNKNLSAKYAISFENATPEVSKIKGAVLIFNDNSCGEAPCIIVRGTGNLVDLPSGEYPTGHYVVSQPLPDKDSSKGQIFSSVFTPKAHAFNLLQGCWNVTKMNPEDFQSEGNGCDDKTVLFNLPDGDSRNYTQSGDTVVPYGWLYASRAGGHGFEHSRMISSSADVMNSVQKSTGFNLEGSVSGGVPGIVEVSAEFSVTRNRAVSTKIQNMYGNEETYSEHKYLETQYVFALDKQNLSLHKALTNEIETLRSEIADSAGGRVSAKTLSSFLEIWGTHYAFAGTFGAKGSAVNRYTKKQVKQLLDKQVNLDKAWSAGLSVKVFGQGGGVKGGQTSKSAMEQYQALESINGSGFDNYNCIGGTSCDGGKPSPGAWVPVFLDLRPLSELLGPPFYKDEATAIVLRGQVEAAIKKYAFEHPAHTGHATAVARLEIGTLATPLDNNVQGWHWTGFALNLPPELLMNVDSQALSASCDWNATRKKDINKGAVCANPGGGTSATVLHHGKPISIGVYLTYNPADDCPPNSFTGEFKVDPAGSWGTKDIDFIVNFCRGSERISFPVSIQREPLNSLLAAQ